jgi:sialate O-acetylesterase
MFRPVIDSMKIEVEDMILHFTHLGGGLVAMEDELKGFTIARADKVFHPARAKIVGETVVVNSPAVPRPIAVRYGWANVPEGICSTARDLPRHRSELKWIEQGVISNKILDFDGSKCQEEA